MSFITDDLKLTALSTDLAVIHRLCCARSLISPASCSGAIAYSTSGNTPTLPCPHSPTPTSSFSSLTRFKLCWQLLTTTVSLLKNVLSYFSGTFLFLFVCLVSWLVVTVCGFETGAHYGAIAGLDFLVDHAGLEFRDPAASASWAPGFRGRCTRPHFHFYFSEIRSLTETAAHQFGKADWPGGIRESACFRFFPPRLVFTGS